MGTKAAEELDVSLGELSNYLHAHHSVYMEVDGAAAYYLTDANESYWRAQDPTKLNEKGHYTDASILVPTLSEFLRVPFIKGKCIEEVGDQAVFYASIKEE